MWQIYHGKCNVIQVAGKRGCPFSAEDDLWRKTSFDARRPLAEDDLWCKTTFDEDDLCQKTTFGGRQPLTEDDLWWKTNFDGRRPFIEDDYWWKTIFDGRGPLTEDDLWRKTTFNRRQLSIGCLVYYLKKMLTTPHLDSHSTADPKPEILSAV